MISERWSRRIKRQGGHASATACCFRWCHVFVAVRHSMHTRGSRNRGYLRVVMPSVERLRYHITSRSINRSTQSHHFRQSKETLPSPSYKYQAYTSRHLPQDQPAHYNRQDVQPHRPETYQLILLNAVRRQQQPVHSQQQREQHPATQQRQQRSGQLHTIRPSQQPMDFRASQGDCTKFLRKEGLIDDGVVVEIA